MSKVFTITEGLENMGAMKTGGQGSVYKGRRVGEIITAIKLLPTPIMSHDGDDRSYRDFTNEVDKLKRVNEEPHPNVVTILSSGVSDTGNFPFIEMEYIEGPDVQDLIRPPHEPVFSIKDVCKVAEHLSHALAHCHKFGVKHGDIKSNNVKFNINTGNYVLLDFGLSVMSDEQRRTSLRQAGAIEFMAPEQNEGDILFETDVYSFGVILFELLAGRVPFPLNDRSESSRNVVRVSHMETPVPDLLQLRLENLPAAWTEEKKEREMHVPGWLIEIIYKCLEKKPEDRFADGIQLHDHIIHSRNESVKNDEVMASQLEILKKANKQLSDEMAALRLSISKQHEGQLASANSTAAATGIAAMPDYKIADVHPINQNQENSVSRKTFMVVLVLAIAFAALAAYSFLGKSSGNVQEADSFTIGTDSVDTLTGEIIELTGNDANTREVKEVVKIDEGTVKERPKPEQNTNVPADTTNKVKDTASKKTETPKVTEPGVGTRYAVTSKAYFYNRSDESSRTNEYIIPSPNVVVRALDDKGDFILVKFKDDRGEVIEGWIRKKDLSMVN